MKQLTAIENKIQKGQELTRTDLVFLYEIDSPIQGFGYPTNGKCSDPRIQEIRGTRDTKSDAFIVFDCQPEQIAWGPSEIREDTKAYVGPLFPNIFQTLKHTEHIFTSFPEGKIVRSQIEIGGKTEKEIERELEKEKIQVSDYARFMMRSKDFITAKKIEPADLVRLKVRDLNLDNPTTENIYKKAEEFGLELCPAEVGPYYRLQYADQPMGEWIYIGMKQISDSVGSPRVFMLGRDDGGPWLHSGGARPTDGWDPDGGFVFRLRK